MESPARSRARSPQRSLCSRVAALSKGAPHQCRAGRPARALPPGRNDWLQTTRRLRVRSPAPCPLAGSVSARRLRAATSRRDEGDGHGAGEWRGHGAGTRRPGIHALVPPPSRVAHFWLSFRRRCAFPSFLPPALICCDRPPSALEGGGRTKHVLEDPSTD